MAVSEDGNSLDLCTTIFSVAFVTAVDRCSDDFDAATVSLFAVTMPVRDLSPLSEPLYDSSVDRSTVGDCIGVSFGVVLNELCKMHACYY